DAAGEAGDEGQLVPPKKQEGEERRTPQEQQKVPVEKTHRAAEQDRQGIRGEEKLRQQIRHRRRATRNVGIPQRPFATLEGALEELPARFPLRPGGERVAQIGKRVEVPSRPFNRRHHCWSVVLPERPRIKRVKEV